MSTTTKAADGGPSTQIHTSLKSTVCATIKVTRKATGDVAVIRADTFDPRLHEKITDKPAETKPDKTDPAMKLQKREAKENCPAKLSDATKDVLGKMPMETLQGLPEYAHVTNEPTTKNDVISGILEVRKRCG